MTALFDERPDLDRAHGSGMLGRSMVGASWSSVEGLATARSLLAGHSSWAWFGGSVTAEGRILRAVSGNLAARGLTVSTSNFGVPATGPEYLSFCIKNVVGGEEVIMAASTRYIRSQSAKDIDADTSPEQGIGEASSS